MDSTAARRLNEPKFIQQHPTTSKYSGRLSKHDKDKVEPLLRRLHAEHANREKMLLECNNVLEARITFAQLDRLRDKLGLQIYNRQNAESESNSQHYNNRASERPSRGSQEGDEMDIDIPSLPSTSPPLTISNNPGLGSRTDSPNSQQSGSSSWPEVLTPLLSASLQIESQKLNHREGQNLSEPLETTILRDQGTVKSPAISDTLDLAAGDGQEPDALSTVQFAPGKSDFPPTSHGAESSLKDVRLPDEFFQTQDDNKMRVRTRRYSHSPSAAACRLYLATRMRENANGISVARLFHTAALLQAARVFDHAFDLFWILYHHYYHAHIVASLKYPRIALAAISSARCARSLSQFGCAKSMVDGALRLLKDSPTLCFTDGTTENCLRILSYRLSWVLGGTPRRLPTEECADIAHWLAAIVSLSEPDGTQHGPFATYSRSSEDDCCISLHSCKLAQVAFLNALQAILLVIKMNAEIVNDLPPMRPSSATSDIASAARALSGLLLRLNPSDAGLGIPESLPVDSVAKKRHYHYLNKLAITIVPFALMEWIEKFEYWYGFAELGMEGCVTLAAWFEYAAEHIRNGIIEDPGLFAGFVDTCLSHFGPSGDHGTAEGLSFLLGCQVESDQWAGISGSVTGLPVAALLAALDKAEDAAPAESEAQLGPNLVEHRQSPARSSQQSLISLPTIARSYRSSNSSSFRSFRSLAKRTREKMGQMVNGRDSVMSDATTIRSSWMLSFISNTASADISLRESITEVSSEDAMSE